MTAVTPPDVERRERLMAAAAHADATWRRLGWRLRAVTPARLVRFLLVVGAVATITWLIVSAGVTLLPFLVGAILAYVLLPLMSLLDLWLPRWRPSALVFAAFLANIPAHRDLLRAWSTERRAGMLELAALG